MTTSALPRACAPSAGSRTRRPRARAAALAVALAAAGTLVQAGPAAAAVPAFPDNIVVFPDRDFVSIEGYEADEGRTMTVTVTRDGQVTGKAEGTIAAGGVALEVNHPGGVCWGTGAGAPNVTPDIRAGDVVTIAVDGTDVADSSSIDAAIGATPGGPAVEIDAQDPRILRIRGHIGAGVSTAQLEQRIIAPDLRDTVIARRDVRAVPGPRTTEPRGQYDSALEFSTPGATVGPVDFVATYWFPTAAIATTAKNGGARIMGWLVEDLDANRQGLTISEFGEPGGPGFGGCPNGPAQSGPPAPTVQSLLQTSSGSGSLSYVFTWTPAVAVPGTPAITGYRVRAVAPADAAGVAKEYGLRLSNPAATGATLAVPVLPTGQEYTFDVSSVNAAGNETNPPVHPTVTPPDITGPVVTTTPSPLLTTFFAPVDVALVSESGAELYYKLSDLTDPVPSLRTGDVPAGDATFYTAPIHLTQTTRVSVIGRDAAGNLGDQADFLYTFGDAPAPAAPATVTASGGEGQATVTWSASPDPTPQAPVVGYTVSWTGPTPGSKQVGTTPLSTAVTGLSAGSYTFTVAARNAAGTGTGTAAAPVLVTEQLTVSAGADRTVARGGSVALGATSPNPGVTYTWTRVDSDSPAALPVTGGVSYLSATNVANPTVTLPLMTLPTNNTLTPAAAAERNAALFYRVTATKNGATAVSDVVKVSVTTDTTSIATGRFRAGQELRLTGSDTNAAATVRIYRKTAAAATFTYVGTVTLTPVVGGTGATFDFRLKPPGFTLATGEQFYAFSTFGGGSGAFTAG